MSACAAACPRRITGFAPPRMFQIWIKDRPATNSGGSVLPPQFEGRNLGAFRSREVPRYWTRDNDFEATEASVALSSSASVRSQRANARADLALADRGS